MAQRLAVARKPRGAVRQIAEPLLLADRDAAIGATAETVDALPALRRKQRDHVVAGRDERDAVADTLHHARPLVTEDAGGVTGRIGAGGGVEIGVADAAGDEPDEHLAAFGSARSTSWTTSGLPNCSRTAARIRISRAYVSKRS